MVCSPASKVIATKGMPRQMFAAITEARALLGSPRKLMVVSITPISINTQEMTESWESYIHQNARADSTVGTMKGKRTMARINALNPDSPDGLPF